MNIPNSFVTKERLGARWINRYFDNKGDAITLCRKIISKGGRATWMRNTL